MKSRALFDADSGALLVPRVLLADSALERLRGLLGHPPLTSGEALLLAPCASVHTCFMSYAIDIVYLDRAGQVRKCVEALVPWRASAAAGAASTLELAAGEVRRLGLIPGRRVTLGSPDVASMDGRA